MNSDRERLGRPGGESLSFQNTGKFKADKLAEEDNRQVVQTMQNTQHPSWFDKAASSCSDISNLRAAVVNAPPSNSAQSSDHMPRARNYFSNRVGNMKRASDSRSNESRNRARVTGQQL